MKSFLPDLRFGLRMLAKSPGFTLTTIAVLALGIGANAAVFSVVEAVLLRSLPLRDPERAVMIWEKNPALGGSIGERLPPAYTNFIEWTRQATQFEAIAGFEDANFNLTGASEPERIEGARASANIFTLFGVKPALGTTFDSAATDPAKTHVAVLTDAFYRSHFGGQRSAIGQTLTLNDVVYTVVGVLPQEFHLPAAREGQDQHSPKLWVPYDDTATQNQTEAKRRKMAVYGRLRGGVTLAQARAEMDGIAKSLAEQDPAQNAGFGINVFPVSVENLGQDLRRNLLVMLGAVGFVLLIACANIANLMLTRAAARQKEMAIRKALGAGGGRLVSQLLAESLLLSGTGALLGLGLAHFGIKALVALRPSGLTRPEDIQLNLSVLLFTLALSILAGIFFGIVPALQAARADVNTYLNQTRGDGIFGDSALRREEARDKIAIFARRRNDLQWFSPTTQLELCGHATLASSYVLFEHAGTREQTLTFQTRAGELTVERADGRLVLDFPSRTVARCEAPPLLIDSLGAQPQEVFRDGDYLAVFERAEEIVGLRPNLNGLAQLPVRGIIERCSAVEQECRRGKIILSCDPLHKVVRQGLVQ